MRKRFLIPTMVIATCAALSFVTSDVEARGQTSNVQERTIQTPEVQQTGWIDVGGRWQYRNEDGSLKQNEWFNSNGLWYYFDWDCLTVVGETYIEGDVYYFAENGVMQKNMWFTDEYNDSYYFGANGVRVQGPTVIDGKEYLFLPHLAKNYEGIHQDGSIQVFYKTDSNGVIITSYDLSNQYGWISVNGSWVYRNEDGTIKQNEWFKFDGLWYYFDWNCLAAVSGEKYIDGNCYYFAKNGVMQTNMWYTDEYNYKYYFGTNGVRAEGPTTIDGERYLFVPHLAENEEGFHEPGSSLYYYKTDCSGVIITSYDFSNQYGWISVNGKWAYRNKNGDKSLKYNEWYNENGKEYYFGWDNFALVGHEYLGSHEYYFDENGALVKNQWVYYDGSYKGYAQTNGVLFEKGLLSIDGKEYYFDFNHAEMNYRGCYNNFYIETNHLGEVVKKFELEKHTGWLKVRDGWIYSNGDGTIKKLTWFRENNAWYYFDYNGITAIGIYDIGDENYAFDESGCMIINQWMDNYYFGNDGRGLTGKHTVNNKTYLFDKGRLVTNGNVEYNGKLYYTNSLHDIHEISLTNKGWHKIQGKWVYVDDSQKIKKGEWANIDGIWYWFDYSGFNGSGLVQCQSYTGNGNYKTYILGSDGRLMKNYWYATRYGWYYADKDGNLLEDGVYNIDGNEYLFIDTCTAEKGMHIIDEVKYVVDQDGLVLSQTSLRTPGWHKIDFNKWYYTTKNHRVLNGANMINGTLYGFKDNVLRCGIIDSHAYDENGFMIKNSWYKVDDNWHYFDENGMFYDGWLNNRYYFEYARMVTGVQLIDGEYYYFDPNGVYIGKLQNGWNYLDGYYYYFKDGDIVNGRYNVDGIDYYFNYSDGRMSVNSFQYDTLGRVYCDQNGHIIKNTWHYYSDEQAYSYFDENGYALNDTWKKINGTWYYFYFDGKMANSTSLINGEFQQFSTSGAWLGPITNISQLDGWQYQSIEGYYDRPYAGGYFSFSEKWCYFENGQKVTGWKIINGSKYYFDENGIAAKGVKVINNKYYYFNDSCALVTKSGWFYDEGTYYYVNNNSTLFRGWKKVNGSWYYLEPEMVTGIRYIDGKYYDFNASGQMIGEITPIVGWNLSSSGDYFYYINNGEIDYDFVESGGKTYCIDSNGRMIKNLKVLDHYLKADGTMAKNEWISTEDGWLYADEYGRVRGNVTLTINGIVYTFDSNGYMV